eukprot:snap_masked-scaffold_37-processed-gene-0.1-mRNA-1 protein AED:1.00 eAED:1.00 QI:0/0/0/0/1/1/2/0/99
MSSYTTNNNLKEKISERFEKGKRRNKEKTPFLIKAGEALAEAAPYAAGGVLLGAAATGNTLALVTLSQLVGNSFVLVPTKEENDKETSSETDEQSDFGE